jgi:hypothetical protein
VGHPTARDPDDAGTVGTRGYAGPVVFSFYVQPYAGWREHGPAVRRHADLIVRLLHNPCLGQRLRHPSGNAPTRHRWDAFCKLDLPNRLRLIYRREADAALVVIELIGYHVGAGRTGDVYDALQDAFALPSGQGHDQMAAGPCCENVDPAGREVREQDARAALVRLARR